MNDFCVLQTLRLYKWIDGAYHLFRDQNMKCERPPQSSENPPQNVGPKQKQYKSMCTNHIYENDSLTTSEPS